MYRFRILIVLFTLFAFSSPLHAQNSDMDAILNEGADDTQYTFATFKSFRVVNGHSIEMLKKKHLLFTISHRFNRLDQGVYDIFGLDQASIRIGFDYGITDWLQIGVGRSTFEKTYDGYFKARLLRQSKGKKNMPVSLALLGTTSINTLKSANVVGVPEGQNFAFENRLAYTTQLILARKFNSWLSLQLSPTWVHRNYVENPLDKNSVFAVGGAGRVKVSKRVAINAEYHYLIPEQIISQRYNALSLGVDIETGGHVFQLHLTNARTMVDKAFIAGPNDDITSGGIFFGFNIVRTFSFDK